MKCTFFRSTALMFVVLGLARRAPAQTAPKSAAGDAQPLAVLLEQGIYQEETAGNLEAAAKSYQQIVDQAAVGRSLVAQALARLATLQVKQKQLDEARKTVERLKTEYPEQKDAIAKADTLLPNDGHKVSAGRVDHDEDPFVAAVPSAEEKAKAAELAKQGWQQYRDGKFRLAEDLFRRATVLDVNSADAWTGLGWSLMNLNPNTGQNEFALALNVDPKNAMALNGMGWVNSHYGGDDAKARTLDYWRRAVDADPTATSPMRGLAQSAYQNADFDEAIKWYEKWLALDPKSADGVAGLERAKAGQKAVSGATSAANEFFKRLDDEKFAEAAEFVQPGIVVARLGSGQISFRPSRSGGGASTGETSVETKQGWVNFLKSNRDSFGKLIGRKITGIQYFERNSFMRSFRSRGGTNVPGVGPIFPNSPQAPDVVLLFATQFENKRNCIETIGLRENGDGEWKVVSYSMQESEVPRDPLKD